MKVVIDTNILLFSIPSRSKNYWVFKNLIEGKYTLCLTTDILLEYEEIFSFYLGKEVAVLAIESILNLPNIELVIPFYNWDLIKADTDDNKFIDCAVAGNAKYLVSNDRHFNVLRKIKFPKIEVINMEEFKSILKIK